MKKAINILMAAAMLSTCAAVPYSAAAANVSAEESVKNLAAVEEGEMMTMKDVIELSKKGDALDWSDFDEYVGKDGWHGIGMYTHTYSFDLGEGYVLYVGGNQPAKPETILLYRYDPKSGIDIRESNIDDFLNITAYNIMTVIVTEVRGSDMLVTPSDSSIGLLTLPKKYLDDDIEPVEGMELEVTFSGGILETYPGQFGNVKRVTVVSDEPKQIKGDANNDGQVDMADVVLIMQSLANPNKYQLTEQGRINADMDGNGITVADAQAIQMMLLGLDKEKEPPVSEIASLDFKTSDEVIKAVNNTDLSKYESPCREAYKDMFARFKSDGFIYSVKTNDDVKIKDNSKIWLQPYHALMDVYIKYSVTYKGKNYDVLFRNADVDIAAKTSGITEYLSKREKRDTYKESVFEGKTYAVLPSTDGSQIAASTFTDDKHYVTVVGHGTSQDELREMLGALEYEKLSINTGDDPLQPSTPQPIGFKDVDEVITLMHRYVSGDHSDLNNYPEKYREDYQQIFERFFEDGCVWQVVNTEDVSIKEGTGTALFPRTKYEDIGIGYYVTYNGKTYHVTFYCADRGVLSETDGIAEYLKKRMGRSSDKLIDVKNMKASLLFADNGQTYANAFIGDKHYIDVIGISSEEEMTGFLNALVIYKNYLTQICVQQPPVATEDAGFTTEGGKRVSFGLYAALRQYENTNVQIAVTPKYNTDGNYVYNGKTIQQYHNEWDEESDLSEKYGQLLKEGDKLKYGEALYTTGAPDGEKWDKNWYDIRVNFYGEDFLAKYIVNGEFLRDKVLADQEEYLNGNTINHAYNMLHEAIDAYEAEMMQETVSQLEAQNIRYEYINGGKNLAFYVTAAQFEDLALNVSSFGLAADTMTPIADDMGMVVYTHDD